MKSPNRYPSAVFVGKRLLITLAVLAGVFVLSYFIPVLLLPTQICLGLVLMIALIDVLILFTAGRPLEVERVVPERFSNGDENPVEWIISSRVGYNLGIRFLDELPQQLAERYRAWQTFSLKASGSYRFSRSFRPQERGLYRFSRIVIFLKSPLGFMVRRIALEKIQEVKVYPSFLDVRKYSLLAYSDIRSASGNRVLKRLGHSMEFEQIKEYVSGDDIRAINWKATARTGQLMLNHYTDEKAQQIYCVIDKGRAMKTPFDGLSLMDYAINATLMLSRVALIKQDKVGVVTFAGITGNMLKAERKSNQMNLIMESLYREETEYKESDFEWLYVHLKKNVPHRSLIILFTNFESKSGMDRQLNYLKSIASRHLLLVVFFENTELQAYTGMMAHSVEDIYYKTIARQFSLEKRQMVRELQQAGILSLLATPESLTIQTVNRYLELKHRQLA